MNTTQEKHQSLIDHVVKDKPLAILNNSSFFERSIIDEYWLLVKKLISESNLNIFELISNCYSYEISSITSNTHILNREDLNTQKYEVLDTSYVSKLLKTFYSFLGKKIIDFFQYGQNLSLSKDGITIIGYEPIHMNRAIAKMKKENIDNTIVYENALFVDSESDYDTAIELVTWKWYEVPAVEVFKITDNLFYCRANPSYNLTYSKKNTKLVGYGTHWM